METPKTLTQLRRFIGMVNQLGKFSPQMSDLSQPLCELLSPKQTWVWTDRQDIAFENVKRKLTKPVVLALYDPAAETKIWADASTYGLRQSFYNSSNTPSGKLLPMHPGQ